MGEAVEDRWFVITCDEEEEADGESSTKPSIRSGSTDISTIIFAADK